MHICCSSFHSDTRRNEQPYSLLSLLCRGKSCHLLRHRLPWPLPTNPSAITRRGANSTRDEPTRVTGSADGSTWGHPKGFTRCRTGQCAQQSCRLYLVEVLECMESSSIHESAQDILSFWEAVVFFGCSYLEEWQCMVSADAVACSWHA